VCTQLHPKELDEEEIAQQAKVASWAAMDSPALCKALSLASLVSMVQNRAYKIPKDQIARALVRKNQTNAFFFFFCLFLVPFSSLLVVVVFSHKTQRSH
jgi:hypothetical protein